MFPFFESSGNILLFRQFLNIVTMRFNFSVARHFQYANTDHVIFINFIKTEFTDDFLNRIFCEFNV